MHLRSATMPAQLQQTGVLETMESPSLEGRNNSAKALAEIMAKSVASRL